MLLDYLRKRKSGIVSWVVVGGIALVFLFWGIGTRREAASRAAKVNGQELYLDDVDREARTIEQRYRQVFGGNLPEGLLSRTDVQRQAVDNLIVRTLLRQEAARLRLTATDAEVQAMIMSHPQFQTDGRFDRNRYIQMLGDGAAGETLRTPTAYEAAVRESLTIEKVERLVRDAVTVTDAEARQGYADEHDSVSLDFVRVAARPDPKATFPENEIAAYYESHKSDFVKPATVTVAAAVVDPAALAPKLAVSDDELKQAFEAREDELAAPPEVSARHILVALPEDAAPDATEAARKKAQAALDRIRKGEDFGKVALEVSDDKASTRDPKRAGDLGFFRRGEMAKPFEDAAFALKPGQLAGPVRTQFGFHVIRVDDARQGRSVTLADVRDKLQGDIRQAKAAREASDLAEKIADAAARSGDLAAEARSRGIPVKTEGPLFEGVKAPALGPSGKVVTEALRLQAKQISPPVEDGRTWYVLQATSRTETSVLPVAQVSDRIRDALARQRAAAAARERAEKLLEAARASGLQQAARAAGLQVETTGPFQRRAPQVPKLGAAREVADAAFRLSPASPVGERVFVVGDDAVVIRHAARKAADPAGDRQGLGKVRQALEREKSEAAVRELIETRRADARIWINPQFLPQAKAVQ